MRKAVGAARAQLIGQLLAESVVLAGLASALALGLVELTLPVLEALSGKTLAFDVVRDGWAVLALGMTVGVLAGIYPAVVLSGARPVLVLKGQGGGRGHRSRLRQALIAGQFLLYDDLKRVFKVAPDDILYVLDVFADRLSFYDVD